MSQKQKYEIVYFPLKGRANLLRCMLADQGVQFKDTHVKMEDWPTAKAKYPFGQLPLLIVNGDTHLAQSHTIARYLAREHGLMGSNSLEQAQVEMWVDQVLDLRNKFYLMVMTNFQAGLQPFLESLPSQLEPFETRLAAGQPKGARFVALGRLSLADYALFDLLFILRTVRPDCLDKSPMVKEFHGCFAERPGLKAYMSTDEYKALRTSSSPNMP